VTWQLDGSEVDATAGWIASVQLANGMIPWFPGGHADPWNHTEAAMALAVTGRFPEAERAYEWLAATQLPDGGWCLYHLAEGIEEPRRDPNVCAYPATGLWWHYLSTGDAGLLEAMWPMVEAAIGFVLRLQRPDGSVAWSLDVDGHVGRFALLTGTSSIHHSLRCAVAIAETLGEERPDWELAAARAGQAVAHRPSAFLAKDRWAMDWYYPILCGAVRGEQAWERVSSAWAEFVMDGVGVRCVSDHPWVTAAETAECAMALDSLGLASSARMLLGWTRHMRDADGAYWTGCVHPRCVRYPGGERSTYTAAAVLLAHHVLADLGPAGGLFRGESIPDVMDLAEVAEPIPEG
jgi:hypothetical protein